ncbi:hypothetical protein NDU88_002521 [Pleurodeles waltl]|uniref:Uncharacterized protein n=1 Tax=Pleurodeles waltl TaxID=8319 RepID=A0AAV7LCQ4_PLEWA|nr:hypothetical protein NDU88_002521 [Pleurodeles waltl]
MGRFSLPWGLRILPAEGRGCNGFTVLSRPPFWVAAAAKLPECFPVVIMAGFKIRAWIPAQERRTTRAAPSVPGHAPGKFIFNVEEQAAASTQPLSGLSTASLQAMTILKPNAEYKTAHAKRVRAHFYQR